MSEKLLKFLKESGIQYALFVAVLLLLYNYVFFFAWVPSGSMIPTILERSVVFVTRIHNIEKDVERGDIIVFKSEEMDNILLVKRLVGLPGEKLVINDEGQVSIDGVPIEESYVKHWSAKSGEFEIPEGCYFFMGDNRRSSVDARFWENPYIPESEIKGKAVFTLWPVSKFGILK